MNFAVYPGELPEPIRQMMDQHEMANQSNHHAVFTMFDELSADHIKVLSSLFHILAQENSGIAHYLEGIATTYLRLKHDICLACGGSHTPNFEEAKDQTNPPESKPVLRADPTPEEEAEYNSRLDKYNLEHVFLKGQMTFRCRGCGQAYPSIEDRELKRPGDCEGCHQKAKWG